MRSREESIREAQGRSFDICVIGGGASGAGSALDAQLRGLRTVLVEAGDFGSATSSASTKLAHGGLRYLEQAVREIDASEYRVLKLALRERALMLDNAPYLTRTQQFLTVCDTALDLGYYALGLRLYDRVASSARLAPSRVLSRRRALERIPTLTPERLAGAVAYADGQFDDARFNLALVATFVDAGGVALNYARVTAFERDPDGRLSEAEVEEAISGRRFPVRARAFLNATGPWADRVRELASPGSVPRLRLSRGVHIVLPAETLDSATALLIPRTEDGRVLFAIPWMGRVLVGTTETETGLPGDRLLTPADIDYLLRHLNRHLVHPVVPGQIVSGFAGVRPLLRGSSRRETKRLPRDYVVERDPASGLVSLLGGKWTTYRAMAETAIDVVQTYLGGSVRTCTTAHRRLAGSEGYAPNDSATLARRFGLTEACALHLDRKYGSRAQDVLHLVREDPELGVPLVAGLAPLRAEVVFAARCEMALTIEDVLARRIGLQYYGWQEAISAGPTVARILGKELGWSEPDSRKAMDDYAAGIQAFMARAGLDGGRSAQGPALHP